MPLTIKVDLLNAETILFFDREFININERNAARLAWQALDGMDYGYFLNRHNAGPSDAEPPDGYDCCLIDFGFDQDKQKEKVRIRIGMKKHSDLVVPLKKF